ncbi:uncharacterized protein LOC120841790 [Ixodes scapularis]|uniref:uncharacterized protein LOC120841790 n=1 Tax=Ixodes scapularis TaxID=6945 RepID=UPI001AA002FD|nr:uncharacterized protein LOC120841790 [Ixodes scapularis]
MEIEKLVALGTKLDLSGAELKRWIEEETAKQREERALEREATREATEREQEAAKAAAERELEILRLRLELENKKEGNRSSGAGTDGEGQSVLKLNPNKLLLAFDERKDDLDAYIRRFEGIALSQKWPENQWATALSTCLTGEALSVYGRLPPVDAADYGKVKASLLKRFRFTVEGFRDKFRDGKPVDGETATQYAARLGHYFDRWVELAAVTKDFEGLRELVIKEQFLKGCHPALAIYLKERKQPHLEGLLEMADQFLDAQGRSNLGKAGKDEAEPSGKKSSERGGPPRPAMRCYLCNKTGHKAAQCRSLYNTGQVPTCQRCGRKGHKTEVCRGQTKPQASGIYMPRQDRKDGNVTDGFLELKDGTKIPVVNAVMTPRHKFLVEGMPVVEGTIGQKKITVLRDTGSNTVIVRRGLVDDGLLTGTKKPVYLVDGTVKMLPEAHIHVKTPYFNGGLKALCMDGPLYDLVLGNIPGAREPDDPATDVEVGDDPIPTGRVQEDPAELDTQEGQDEPGRETRAEVEDPLTPVCAVETRTQSKKKQTGLKKLHVPQIEGLAIDTPSFAKEQEEDDTLRPCFKRIGERARGKTATITYTTGEGQGLLYRVYRERSGRETRQLVVPQTYRKTVLQVAHESIMAGHLGQAKTKSRILEEFFWPGLGSDVRRFVLSCDVCQRTTPKGKVPRVPLGGSPLIDTPFQRVAIDIVGPMAPASGRGNRYILTMVDYATRYPDAVALPSIETERVAEALVEMFARVGMPREILSDRGSNFTSELMKEISRLLSIRQLHTSPYHPMANGLVEKFNGTLKLMLKRMCSERPKDWDRYLPALLFAYREVPQASLGFSPFELLYGRHVRGPLAILREVWTNVELDAELRTTYEHVLDLRNRLEETCKIAHEELARSGARYARYYNRKTKERSFQPGEKVLLLLPTDNNKLLLQWKGPFLVTRKTGEVDYEIQTATGLKLFHANLLKKYEERGIEKEDERQACAVLSLTETEDDQPIPLPAFQREEGPGDAKVSSKLSAEQKSQLDRVMRSHENIFSDVPGKTTWIQCELKQTTDTPIYVRQYPLPFATHTKVEEEEFPFTIEHIKGSENVGADFLSRL